MCKHRNLWGRNREIGSSVADSFTADNNSLDPDLLDPTFLARVERLHQLTVYGRWLVALALWLTVGTASLWGLRYPISLLLDYFTWSAVRYGLIFHLYPAFGLFLCIGMTASILVWQLRNCLFGLPNRDRQRLQQQVLRICQQGSSHPLWRLIQGD